MSDDRKIGGIGRDNDGVKRDGFCSEKRYVFGVELGENQSWMYGMRLGREVEEEEMEKTTSERERAEAIGGDGGGGDGGGRMKGWWKRRRRRWQMSKAETNKSMFLILAGGISQSPQQNMHTHTLELDHGIPEW